MKFRKPTVTLFPLINVTLPNDFWSLVHSHCSVSVAAVVQHINFPSDRRALDTCISNGCVWEGDIVFDLALLNHWDSHIPPPERGHGSCHCSGIVDNHINKLALNLDQCTDAYELISRFDITSLVSWHGSIESNVILVPTNILSLSVAPSLSLICSLNIRKCGVVVECPKGSSSWPDHLASHFIDKGFIALGYDWSNHCSTAASHKFQPSMYLPVDPVTVVQTAVGPGCTYIGPYPLLQCWFCKHTSV